MTKPLKQIVAEAEALGPLPDTSFEQYQAQAAQLARSVRTRVPAHARVEKVTFPGEGRVELRVVVDLDDARAAERYAGGPAVDELIVNNVRLRNPALRVGGERGPRRLEAVLSGECDPASLPLLGSFPLSLRVRGRDDLQIDGFELGPSK